MMNTRSLKLLVGEFTIHRLAPSMSVPASLRESGLFWIGSTDEELSVVCSSDIELASESQSPGWSCFKVEGPIDLSETGVISRISSALAEAGVSIFALSTFDTDYFLVPTRMLAEAEKALAAAGYEIFAGLFRGQTLK